MYNFYKLCKLNFLFKSLIIILIISLLLNLNITAHAEESESESATITKDICHVHTGNSTDGGGCYGKANTTTVTKTIYCNGPIDYYPEYGTSQCYICKEGYVGDWSSKRCIKESYITETKTTYELDCGKTAKTVKGSFSVSKTPTDWTHSVTISCSVSPSSLTNIKNPYFLNGSAIDGKSFTTTENGTYKITVHSVSGASNPSISVSVKNIDNTAPTIGEITLSPEGWTKDSVTATISSATDLQPDGSDGCGLADTPYSYDNGQTWTADSSVKISENGTRNLLIRDRLDNITTVPVNTGNIDKEGPRITDVDYDKTPNVSQVTLKITADDIMSSGKEGCGLAEEPFSFDNGKTWTADGSFTTTKNMNVSIMVRDKLSNITSSVVNIDNIDTFGPAISSSIDPSEKTTEPVTVTWTAKDRGVYSTDGVGLPEDCFSYDNGTTWTSRNTVTVTTNQVVSVMARDLYGNTSTASCSITNIYKKPDPTPTATPTSAPTATPTAVPTATPKPTKVPTATPKPTRVPTATPTPTPGNTDDDYPPKPIITNPVPTSSPTPTPKGPDDDNRPKPHITTVPTAIPTITPSVILKEKKTVKEKQSLAPKENITPVEIPVEDDGFDLSTIILLCLALLLALLGILLLLFLYYRSIFVYNFTGRRTYAFKGIAFISRKNDRFESGISSGIIDSCDTNELKLCFSSLFASVHEGEDITIYFPDKQSYSIKIAKEVKLNIKQ